MNGVLDRLVTVAGIRGAVAFDAAGCLVGAAGPPGVISSLAPTSGILDAVLAVSRARSALGNVNAALVRCERATLMLYRSDVITLVVLGEPNLDTSHGGVGFHVAVALRVAGIRARSSRPPPRSLVVPAGEEATAEVVLEVRR